VSAVLGLFLILGLLFSIQDLPTTLASPTGQPVTQIFLDVVGEKGAIVLMACISLVMMDVYIHGSPGDCYWCYVLLWASPALKRL
jgi:hypothetical protein